MNVVCYERVYYERGLLWTWSVTNVVCYERVCHGRRKDFFQEGPVGNFPKFFSRGGQKWWNLFFTPRNWKNNLFLLIISKSRGGQGPSLPPLSTPMGSVMNVVCYERVCYEQVCYERGLFRMVCYEQVSLERTPQGTILQWQWTLTETADSKSKNMLWQTYIYVKMKTGLVQPAMQ